MKAVGYPLLIEPPPATQQVKYDTRSFVTNLLPSLREGIVIHTEALYASWNSYPV